MEFLNTNEGMLFICVIATIIYCYIMYEVIKAAAKPLREQMRIALRMKAMQMKKEGFTHEQIKSVYEKSEEDFWKYLAE